MYKNSPNHRSFRDVYQPPQNLLQIGFRNFFPFFPSLQQLFLPLWHPKHSTMVWKYWSDYPNLSRVAKIVARNNSPIISSHQAFRINIVAPALQKLPHTHTHTHTKWVSILPQAGSIPRAKTERCLLFCFRIARSLACVSHQHHTSRSTNAHNHRH